MTDFVRIHDKTQLEFKLGYEIDKNKKISKHSVRFYIFIPTNLDIDENSYPKQNFYEDISGYIRFITPKMTIEEINNRFTSLLKNLQDGFSDFKFIKYEIKMLGCSFRAYLRDFSYHLKENSISECLGDTIDNVVRTRAIIKDINTLEFLKNNQHISVLVRNLDEYSSIYTELYLYRIWFILKQNNFYFDLGKKIFEVIKQENAYRNIKKMSQVNPEDKSNEKFVYKYAILKKYFFEILFLVSRTKGASKFLKNLLFSLAAGISMIFATLVAFYSQKKYGNLTFSFFVALVLSYMAKDRIKDLFREIFSGNRVRFFDYVTTITVTGESVKLGVTKERFRYISDKKLPKSVMEIRMLDSDMGEMCWKISENIICYEKQIKLYNENVEGFYKDKLEGLNDIIRLNIEHFTRKMDDQKHTIFYPGKDGVEQAQGKKVYHLNIIAEISNQVESKIYKVRVILSKNGIVRVELPQFKKSIYRRKF